MRRLLCLTLLPLGCDRTQPSPPALPQRAYVWQRDWTSDVSDAVRQAGTHLDGLVVLGAQVDLPSDGPHLIRANLDWHALRDFGKPIGLAIRIEGRTLPLPALVTELARNLLESARENNVLLSEFQLDFDCPERALPEYQAWLPELRAAIYPLPLRITALPSWLKQSGFARLLKSVDGFVLQVHSVPTRLPGERVALFEPERATRWIQQATTLGRPFTVSLPTYTALVGYDESGHSLGMALDGVQPSWPAGTRVAEFGANAGQLAQFATALSSKHSKSLEGLFWYRLPVGTGQRNWRWPTFTAVLQGRPPAHQLEVQTSGDNPIDLSLHNNGEAEEHLDLTIRAWWNGPEPVAMEALPGWNIVQSGQEVCFTRSPVPVPRLLPGGRRVIGWLRFTHPTLLHAEISR